MCIQKPLVAAALFASIFFAPSHVQAGPIVGSNVTGSLRFGSDAHDAFDPANKQVPNGFLNKAGTTVTVDATKPEFGFRDSINFYSADFTDTQLVITDQILGTSNRFTMVFTDDAFVGLTLNKTLDTFPNGGLSATVDGSLITVTWVGTKGTPQFKTLSATFNLTPAAPPPTPTAPEPAATPEPTSIALFLAVGATASLAWRRRKQQ